MRRTPPPVRHAAPKFSPDHPLVASMIELASLFLENPRGAVGRTWHADGNVWFVRPPPISQRCSDDEEDGE